jgi:DinB superfamily
MDPQRSHWNQQQQALRSALNSLADHARAIELFLGQHAMVHASGMSNAGLYSFDDELWAGLSDDAARRIPPKGEHSIAWMIWHTARIEDMTMNILVAGGRQVFDDGDWGKRLNVPIRNTGNDMDAKAIARLSAEIDVAALKAYRMAVGRRTREIVASLTPEETRQKVEARRLLQLKEDGSVLESAQWLLDYWSGLTKAGLLMMPPTRHNFVHLNEAQKVKRKVCKG